MDDKGKGGWNAFSNISFDRKSAVRRIRKAEAATSRHANQFLISRFSNVKLVRKEVSTWLVLMGLMIAGMGLQFAFSQRGYMQQAPTRGGIYSEGTLGPITTLNPLYASSSAENSFSRLVFSSLYTYDQYGYLKQDLATSLTPEQNNTIYKVTMRKDARWSDGQSVTAKDVAFTINLIKNPATRAKSSLRVNWRDVTVKAIDDYTLEFHLPGVYAAFPYALTFPVLPLHKLADVNASALRESPFSQAPIGSGPFAFKLLQQSDAITNYQAVHLTANNHYYGGTPKLEQFELYAYAAQDDLRGALKAGEVNGATDIENVSNTETGSLYKIVNAPIASGVYALFNNTNPIFSDAKVRKALQLGTDMKKVRSAVGGKVLALSLPFLDGQVPNTPAAPELDMAKAAVMLDEAGWKLNGATRLKDGKPMRVTITTTQDMQYQAAANELARQWEALGMKVSVNSIDATNVSTQFVQTVLQQRNFDVLVYELAIGADPDVYAYWHSSQGGTNMGGYNFSNYASRNADAALSSALSRTDMPIRNTKYATFAKQWLDDAPALGLYQPVMEYVVNKNNVALDSGSRLITPSDRYANILNWSVESGAVYKTP